MDYLNFWTKNSGTSEIVVFNQTSSAIYLIDNYNSAEQVLISFRIKV